MLHEKSSNARAAGGEGRRNEIERWQQLLHFFKILCKRHPLARALNFGHNALRFL